MLRAICRLLGVAGYSVEGFHTAQEFLEYADKESPCVVLLDVNLPDSSGLQVHAELLARGHICPVVFLTAHMDVAVGVEAMKAGAFDYLTKPFDDDALFDTVDAALRQHVSGLEHRDEIQTLLERWETLTPREQEVCKLVVEGCLNKEIAASLGTGEKTVKVHRGRAMKKMQARRVADLVRMAGQLNDVFTGQ